MAITLETPVAEFAPLSGDGLQNFECLLRSRRGGWRDDGWLS